MQGNETLTHGLCKRIPLTINEIAYEYTDHTTNKQGLCNRIPLTIKEITYEFTNKQKVHSPRGAGKSL